MEGVSRDQSDACTTKCASSASLEAPVCVGQHGEWRFSACFGVMPPYEASQLPGTEGAGVKIG